MSQEVLTKLLQENRTAPIMEGGKKIYIVRAKAGQIRASLPFYRDTNGQVLPKTTETENRAKEEPMSGDVFTVEGVGSSTSEDWYGTQMSPACLLSMQEQFKNMAIPLTPSHWNTEWDEQMGHTIDATIETRPSMTEGEPPTYLLRVKSECDATLDKCKELARRLERKQKIGMSIGGWFTEIRYIFDEDEEELEAIIVEGVELDHLAITRNPANPDSCDLKILRSTGQTIFRAEEKTDFPKKGDNKKISLANSEYPQFDRAYAESLKSDYPDIWEEGGNIRGNEAFALWGRARSGDDAQEVLDWIKEREAWMARHFEDHLLAGVVAQVKWGGIGTLGEGGMKNLINDEKKKIDDKAEKAAASAEDTRAATAFADLPVADEAEPWDWNTEAQDAVLGEDDWARYKKAHFWMDPEADAKTKGAYKLPFAMMVGGELKAVWNGVKAAMGALNGARGGVDIPDADREAVYAHIKRYYDKFEKEPPDLKAKNNSPDGTFDGDPKTRNIDQTEAASSAREEFSMTTEEMQKIVQDAVAAELRARGIATDPETPEQKIARLEAENAALRTQGNVPVRRAVTSGPANASHARTSGQMDQILTRAKADMGESNPLVQAVFRHKDLLNLNMRGRGAAVAAAKEQSADILRDVLCSAEESGDLDAFLRGF